MIFCLGTDKWESSGEGYQESYRIFNKQVDKDEWQKIKDNLPSIELPLTHWEAWAKWWKDSTTEDKNKITSIKYFDAEIFKGITGIEINETPKGKRIKVKLLGGEIVEGEVID